MSKFKYLVKKYLPDIIILGGLLWFLMQQYRYPISDWQIIDGGIVGKFLGYRYEWHRILSIMAMGLGLDLVLHRLTGLRKNTQSSTGSQNKVNSNRVNPSKGNKKFFTWK